MFKFEFFKEQSYNQKNNAQLNLTGRTHYVDEDTLRCFGSRILETFVLDEGLLFGLIESFKNYDDSRRYRGVIFNIMGGIEYSVDVDKAYKSKKSALKAFWDAANTIDAKKSAIDSLEQEKRYVALQCERMVKEVREL